MNTFCDIRPDRSSAVEDAEGPSPENGSSQGHNLALTVSFVPNSLDSGNAKRIRPDHGGAVEEAEGPRRVGASRPEEHAQTVQRWHVPAKGGRVNAGTSLRGTWSSSDGTSRRNDHPQLFSLQYTSLRGTWSLSDGTSLRDRFHVSISCILGDRRLWVGDTST